MLKIFLVILPILFCGCKVKRPVLAWPVGYTGQSGYIDTLGQWVIKPSKKYSNKGAFYEGFAAVNVATLFEVPKWGYIDTKEKFVIKPKYESASAFSEGVAAVKLNGKTGYINKKGNLIIQCIFDDAFSFHNGLATVMVGNLWGLIDVSGNFVIQPLSETSLYFESQSSYSVYKSNGKYGFIDIAGKVVIDPKFEDVESFSEGVALVSSDRAQAAFIDRNGDTLFSKTFSVFSRNFKEGLAPVQDYGSKEYYYIDKNGHDVFARRFSQAYQFKDGLAVVIVNGKYGVINNKGKYVIPAIFPHLVRERYNFFGVGILPDSVINSRGQVIWKHNGG